jgi:hypothetical protein
MMLQIGLFCVVVLVIIWWMRRRQSEGFTSRDEKHKTIATWWKNTPSPSYALYRVDVPESDVVEYLEVKRAGGKNITTTQLKTII